jgi:hypothetical protein
MARKVTVSLVDDLDGSSKADETVEFRLDGVNYQIDLSSKNAAKLRDDFSAWVDASRRTGGRRRGMSVGSENGRTSAARGDSAAIRQWALQKGHVVAARGRIPAHVIDAFHTAGQR